MSLPYLLSGDEDHQHLVELEPDAVELVDQTMLELAAEIPQFQEKLKRFVKGKTGSLLMVEFAGTELSQIKLKMKELDHLISLINLILSFDISNIKYQIKVLISKFRYQKFDICFF